MEWGRVGFVGGVFVFCFQLAERHRAGRREKIIIHLDKRISNIQKSTSLFKYSEGIRVGDYDENYKLISVYYLKYLKFWATLSPYFLGSILGLVIGYLVGRFY